MEQEQKFDVFARKVIPRFSLFFTLTQKNTLIRNFSEQQHFVGDLLRMEVHP